VDSKTVKLLSKVCAFYEEKGHTIMVYVFVFFHIKANILGHVQLQNVARALMDQPQE
jgi:hypothetical protein